MQNRITRIAQEITRPLSLSYPTNCAWYPPVNMYRCETDILVVVEIAGVEGAQIQLTAEPRRLTLRGSRIPPEVGKRDSIISQVLIMEIDHGTFERSIMLPEEVDSAHIKFEHREGFLWISLPLAKEPRICKTG